MSIETGDTADVWNESENQYMNAEILKIKTFSDGTRKYFIHFNNINKRFDDWVTIDKIDMKSLQKKQANKPKSSDAQKIEEDLKFLGNSRNIEYLRMGDYHYKCWYFSPVPEPYFDLETLYCCEFCLRFFSTLDEYEDHCSRCKWTHPPGDEIYRHGHISAYEIDGGVASRWCTNLCLITKFFLFHKSAYYGTDEFLFYVMCFNDTRGAHPCGFFSKEKRAECQNNLSCILSFPAYQKTGVGRFLIQLSYELSKIEKRTGGPETPLSDLGLMAYSSYWKAAVLKCIVEHEGEKLSVASISAMTGMTEADVMTGARKGGYLVKVDDRSQWVFGATKEQVRQWREKERKRLIKLDPKSIRWSPYPRK
ncbi:MOZ/SAS family protein [Trichomonas vaginalis G3]|uniref:histone acetyltransferase n=1 Tax=Trichomonas vaginalis (strain ATCC PRA-98 / G3) TaxID=412133 RepID=A2G4N9_TRIV3|nr:histone acetyltransferase protein [Trichomonas vaginalis G3]EAX87884.1 MOZ/SAS family protein [Trichomonas vaginalis G3]KAI5518577.1 histone acetyltransferase protein [Trichomonas vaginalis G3]|eukprot:XP_001300814.1 MOZ/SAS family protein [Trichomonas vaginalis G3]